MIYGNRIMTQGALGEDIKRLQQRLKNLNVPMETVDGHFGSQTIRAVKSFQYQNSLKPDGIVGPHTYKALELADFPPVLIEHLSVLINLSMRSLSLLENGKLIRQYPVAIGKPETPSPVGLFELMEKISNPGGVLGTRWMGINIDAYGIHGTPNPELIGQAVSHGCIRMHNWNVEVLYPLLPLGAKVEIKKQLTVEG